MGAETVYPYTREKGYSPRQRGESRNVAEVVSPQKLFLGISRGEYTLGASGPNGHITKSVDISMNVNGDPVVLNVNVGQTEQFLQYWYGKAQRYKQMDPNEKQQTDHELKQTRFSRQMLKALFVVDFCVQKKFVFKKMPDAPHLDADVYEPVKLMHQQLPNTRMLFPFVKDFFSPLPLSNIDLPYDSWAYAHYLSRDAQSKIEGGKDQQSTTWRTLFDHNRSGAIDFARTIYQASDETLTPQIRALASLPSLYFVNPSWKWLRIEATVQQAETFTMLQKSGELRGYSGPEGYIALGKKLKIHLGSLHTLASALGVTDELGWQKIDATSGQIEAFTKLKESDGFINQYRDVQKYIELGKQLKIHLGHLHSIASALGVADELGWQQINATVGQIEAFTKLQKSGELLKDYKGIDGYIALGKKFGMHPSHLYTIASALGVADELGWQRIETTDGQIEAFNALKNSDGFVDLYRDTEGYIAVGKQLKIHLGSLHTIASALGIADELGWQKIDATVGQVEAFTKLQRSGDLMKDYSDSKGYIALGKQLGIHLGHLHTIASALGIADELGWQKIDATVGQVEAFTKLQRSGDLMKDYSDSKGYIALGKRFNLNYESLYKIASALGVADELGWQQINATVGQVEAFTKLQRSGELMEDYQRIDGYVALGKRFNMHLGHLHSIASALRVSEKLGWQQINASLKQVESFIELRDSGELIDQYKKTKGYIALGKKLDMHLEHLYSIASALGLTEQLKWRKIYASIRQVEMFTKLHKSGELMKDYQGIDGYVAFGKRFNMHLGHLHSIASAFELTESLGWKYINATVDQIELFTQLHESGELMRDYQGINGYIALGKRFTMHYGALYTIASAFELPESLGWKQINASIDQVELFTQLHESGELMRDYKGINGYIAFGKQFTTHYGSLYSIASAHGLTEELEWSRINASIDQVEAFTKLEKSGELIRDYNGIIGSYMLGKQLNMNLVNLYTIASALDLTEQLGWKQIAASPEQMETFIEFQNSDEFMAQYQGVDGYITLGERSGIPLRNLFSIAAAFELTEELEWQTIYASVEEVKEFKELMESDEFVSNYQGQKGYIAVAKEMGIPLGGLYTIASALGVARELRWERISYAMKHVNDVLGYIIDDEGAIQEENIARFGGINGLVRLKKILQESGNSVNVFTLVKLATAYGVSEQFDWPIMEVVKKKERERKEPTIVSIADVENPFDIPEIEKITKKLLRRFDRVFEFMGFDRDDTEQDIRELLLRAISLEEGEEINVEKLYFKVTNSLLLSIFQHKMGAEEIGYKTYFEYLRLKRITTNLRGGSSTHLGPTEISIILNISYEEADVLLMKDSSAERLDRQLGDSHTTKGDIIPSKTLESGLPSDTTAAIEQLLSPEQSQLVLSVFERGEELEDIARNQKRNIESIQQDLAEALLILRESNVFDN